MCDEAREVTGLGRIGLGKDFGFYPESHEEPQEGFFFFKHLYWSIIALQWCVSFCFITE